jgi:ATP-dependent helicase/nuclease subunit A
VTTQQIADGNSFADWLALWFGVRSAECGVRNETEGALPELRWRIVEDVELADGDKAEGRKQPAAPKRSEGGKAETELPALDEKTKDQLQKILEWKYPFVSATKSKAKSSVTELRRAAEELDEEAEQIFKFRSSAKRRAGTLAQPTQKRKLSAAEAGAAHHKFLQHVALNKTGAEAMLAAEAQRLEREKRLSADERTALDLEALVAFWNSPLGKKIRAQPPESVKRELPFTAKFSPVELAQITGMKVEAGLENEFVVVQGVVDLAVLLPKEIWLVDFKTDDVAARDLPEKIKTHTPQLKIYAAALEKIFARKVTLRALHFLAARRSEKI